MTDFGDLYDEALAKQIEEQEAEEASDAEAARAESQLMAALAEESLKQTEADAETLVGAEIGNLRVLRREKPGKRWLYVCHERRSGQEVRLRGFQLVRVARESVTNGLPVEMPREPWRDEASESA